MSASRLIPLFAALSLSIAGAAAAQQPVSAPIGNIRYDVTFNRETASRRSLGVAMQFDVTGAGEVLLSLPSWTPGAYEVCNYARWVAGFSATAGGRELRWDKLDYDTWRIRPAGAKQVTVGFAYRADSLDNAMAWSRPDFAFFNGTNIFLYPEGRSLAFPATVAIHTEDDWKVATAMAPAGAARSYREKNFHDLVDMPFFVGAFDYDSAMVDGVNARLATYPAGALAGDARASFWEDYEKLFAPQSAVFGEMPFTSYTTFQLFDKDFGGGSALEHQRSHFGIYTPQAIGQPWFVNITAHEMFHSWNVKRLRPADMVPYRYDVAQPTPWLWVSEGITDYYADLTVVRAGLVDSAGFFALTNEKIGTVDQSAPVALEDASLSTWIHPTDGSGYLYYPKGSLAGFMLDILIRHASGNRRSLDDVMRQAYRTTYKSGRGFTSSDWWGAVRAAAGRDFPGFNDRFIDGRAPFPWDSILPLGGMRLAVDTVRIPRLGIESRADSNGVITIVNLTPDGPAAAAGVRPGDILLSLGDISVSGLDPFETFRTTYAGKEGVELPIKVRRDGQTLTFKSTVRLAAVTSQSIVADPDAGALAAGIRHGILTGTTIR
jgi:predicted metalloprotease with PDZ domain